MTLKHLRIDGVRCLDQVTLDLDEQRNYLWGANGAGKTSCLEAIYLLGRGRSFRQRQTAKLVRHGQDSLSVFGITRAADSVEHRLGVEFSAGRLSSQLDGEPAPGQAEMLRLLPVHVIDPRLHQLVEAGPSERRRYIDSGVFHVEHRFLADWRHYRRVLGQRNAALKAGVPGSELKLWSEPLVTAAMAVHEARATYVESLGAIAAELGKALVGHDVMLEYRPGWRRGIDFSVALGEHLERDRTSGFTQVGPHRADLRLEFDSGGVRETASRGQQKLVAAALVIAQVRLFEERTGQQSTVLVDDASAELDQEAQGRLQRALHSLKSQLVLTGLSVAALEPEKGFPVFHVERGKVQAML
jgi:DNA replication and repair protein RecF